MLRNFASQSSSNSMPNQQANVSKSKECDDHLFATVLSSSFDNKGAWIIGSGCTNHMTRNSKLFKELDTSINVSVRMGNGAVVKSVGRGTIFVPTKKGMKLISNVLLVPELDQNLLSVSQMVSHGYSLVFYNNHYTIFYPVRKEIANVAMENKSFSFM